MHVLSWYLVTLPFGYWLVARYYPDGPMAWGEFLGLALLVGIWPLTLMAMVLAKFE